MRTIQAHTGIRGAAALLVVLYHLQFWATHRLPIERATALPSRGYLAVDLFFMLSGFIISYVNRADRGRPMAQAEGRRFLAARLARLYPALLASLAVMVMVAVAETLADAALHRPAAADWSLRSLATLGAQALLLNAWVPGLVGWNIPTWSISAELAAYLLFPVIVASLARAPRAAPVALAAGALAFYLALPWRAGGLDRIDGPVAVARCVAGFALGVALYTARDRVARWSEGWTAAAQAVALAIIIGLLAVPAPDQLVLPAFALLVVASWTDRGWPARLLGSRPLRWLGDVSYAVYLLHVPVIGAAGYLWPHVASRLALSPTMERSGWLALVFATVLGGAWLVFARVERPGRRWLVRRLGAGPLPPIATAPAAP